jgi:hypothetical protein
MSGNAHRKTENARSHPFFHCHRFASLFIVFSLSYFRCPFCAGETEMCRLQSKMLSKSSGKLR